MPANNPGEQDREEVRRARLLQEARDAFARVANAPVENAAWQAELAAWDVTIADGLEPEPELDPRHQ